MSASIAECDNAGATLAGIRQSLFALVGWLVLSVAAPSAALAAATPTPTPSQTPTPAPQREPAVRPSPSPAPARAAASPVTSPVPSASAPTVEPPTPTPQDDVAEASVDWRAFVPTDTADHLATMDRAARESNCGVPWQLLAAIARVESDFGRNMATSTAGAIGYGQFLPSSWQSFGSDGNAYDYRAALPAIALYLCQSGLERDPRAALFAYNHAEWYVDLVLDLAVRYDRMAPGAPTPDVLSVGPARQNAVAMRYADGRDLRLQSRPRRLDAAVTWLGVPWRGRAAGQPIGAAAMQATTLGMLRLAFSPRPATPDAAVAGGSEDLASLANAAWEAGLLAEDEPRWSLATLRRHLSMGQAVIVYVGSKGLPGHPPDEDNGEQPLVLIGATASGVVYSDPSFSSSLGYGLEMDDQALLSFWDMAARPRQALAFGAAPRPLARQTHLAQAEPPEPLARETATPTPIPTPSLVPVPSPTPTPVPPTPAPAPAAVGAGAPVGASRTEASPQTERTWLLLAAVGGALSAAFLLRRRRARRSR